MDGEKGKEIEVCRKMMKLIEYVKLEAIDFLFRECFFVLIGIWDLEKVLFARFDDGWRKREKDRSVY